MIKRFAEVLYAINLAQALHNAPFAIDINKLPYRHYRCVWCFKPAGTRVNCRCTYRTKKQVEKVHPEVFKSVKV